MTLQEKIVISAYTGFVMCDFSRVHKYIKEKMGRPVWTHEMAASNKFFREELTKRVKPDFLKICESNTEKELKRISANFDEWAPCEDAVMSEAYIKKYTESIKDKKNLDMDGVLDDARADMDYCHNCDKADCPIVQLRKLVKEGAEA